MNQLKPPVEVLYSVIERKLTPELHSKINEWNDMVQKNGDYEFRLKLEFLGAEIITKLIETCSSNQPYKGIYLCGGHGPFNEPIPNYESKREALDRLRWFNKGKWTFVDLCYGKNEYQDQQFLDYCDEVGLEARLLSHNMNCGFLPELEESSFDVAAFQKQGKYSTAPVVFQYKLSRIALKKDGLGLLLVGSYGKEPDFLLTQFEKVFGMIHEFSGHFSFGNLYRLTEGGVDEDRILRYLQNPKKLVT